ncbi:type II secretion system protein GspM [Sphingomonas sp. dw_22]|uniref:type II secretion system protein GspM n=1 Tax=Sphingomonas sp. dw_22 TaxID=2721175 RepID=UPI001BD1D6D2|nr:type II secretion system protein GspM [Sphingomonas sp. dw_22]
MTVIRKHLPALDVALIRFDAWWSGLSRREHVMFGVLAALLAGLVLVFGVIKPLQSARAEALSDIRTYETLTARIRAAGTLGASATPRRQGTAAQVVSGSASSFGLVATPEAIPGGVRATIADGTYDSLMAWLADLSASSDLRVRRLSIVRRPAAGRVSASVDFAQ